VGLLAPNLMGLYDMLGNVAEWCRDGFADTYSYDYGDTSNPGSGTHYVHRGGNYAGSYSGGSDGIVNMVGRGKFTSNTQWDKLGFRLSLTCE
ncbi:MAG: SUMF1/EgtB/PvdO family nonheme iron enzyme, partial [Kiritimatiellae bacterium]|nr:SUMF1/EgtB/PvdO family nonheme iron enzyme [Kiritimatiellia bacterium]